MFLTTGLLLGSVVGWLLCHFRLQARLTTLRIEMAQLQEARLLEADKQQWLESAQKQLQVTFEALAGKSLQTNADEFLKRASERVDLFVNQVRNDWATQKVEFTGVVNPLKENLSMLDNHVRALEQKREGAYQAMQEQLRNLTQTHATLQSTTTTLAQALKSPTTRGRWGELQLRRVVEMAGMVKHVDFIEQAVVDAGRPDLISYLPNRGILPVDSKVPLNAYLEAVEAHDEATRRRKLGEHVKAVRERVNELSRKQYWAQFAEAPDFVVMFVPNEACLSAAYEHDPELLEYAVMQKVLIATPVTLLALLRAVAYGWQHHQLAENAQQIAELGKEVHKRLGNFVGHFTDLRTALDRSVQVYNKMVGSFDNRVLPTVRKLEEMGVANGELTLPETIVVQVRLSVSENR